MTFKKVRLVTDSASDIPPELVEKWNIAVVPAFVNYGGQSYADDGVELVREDFYRQMPTMSPPPTTSAPPPALAEEIISKAFEGVDHLIILTVPQKLSGLYNSLRLGASNLPAEQVTLIDSGMVSMGLGWQVLIGAEVAAETGDVEKTLAAIERVRANQRVYATLATLEFLRRSGRVSWATASVGMLLQIKPVIEVREGDVLSVARVRTFNRAMREVARLAREQAPLDRLAVLHTSNPEGADELKALLADVAPPQTLTLNITPTIGTHIGPGAVGVATVSKSWRQDENAIGA